ncbi:alpha/beta fold hydrolase [Paraflavitalea speifideaquila]|uniref:alpha/beta fold hydrolase n=1 Tax=Paraflavitalea speifideaquila TaxID=3076558 RepID=UPI0028E28176|nr:alpha/beta fold hydrolase [Paraflavitalea speifideiaquila]
MNKQVLFIHGGGDDGYGDGAKLVTSLQAALRKEYQFTYPQMPWEEQQPDYGWLKRIGAEIDRLEDNAIWMGHSLGGSMLLKYLAENKITKKAAGIFLLAPPFWSGKESWKQGLILQQDFAQKLSTNSPIFFYHCQDDDVVPVAQIATYKRALPEATFRSMERGGTCWRITCP